MLADDALTTPSTKAAAKLRADWKFEGAGRKLTVICSVEQDAVWKSFRNLEDVIVVASSDIDVADVMWGRGLVVSETVLKQLEGAEA